MAVAVAVAQTRLKPGLLPDGWKLGLLSVLAGRTLALSLSLSPSSRCCPVDGWKPVMMPAVTGLAQLLPLSKTSTLRDEHVAQKNMSAKIDGHAGIAAAGNNITQAATCPR